MCGIVGIYLKNKKLKNKLGLYMSKMIDNMSSRGPDSAGFAIYNEENSTCYKYSICFGSHNFENLKKDINRKFKNSKIKKYSDHAVVSTKIKPKNFKDFLRKYKDVTLVGYGKAIEIFKQVGSPSDVVKRFKLSTLSGTHAIGHTRMATESAITTDGSHPYSTGEDECLVHNGSLSNHNNLRRTLKKDGIDFKSENDTEVAAGYISKSLSDNIDLKDTLKKGLSDLDGFYTFITGTRKGFAIVRDEIACKPAVIAETKDYVAIASEFQAMAHLPEVSSAKIFEPEPGIVYSWGKS